MIQTGGEEMLKSAAITLCLIIFISSAAFADNLGLIRIDNAEQLQTVNDIIDHASGRLDDRFIVFITDSQTDRLKQTGIALQVLARGINSENFYLVSKSHSGQPQPPLTAVPVYSKSLKTIAELYPADIISLKKSGYNISRLGLKETPFFFRPPSVAAQSLDSYPTDSLVSLISQDSLYNYVQTLVNFQTRYIETDSILSARDWLIGKFQGFGYTDVDAQYFNVEGGSHELPPTACYNVICTKPGSEQPDKIIVIGGHYDSYVFGPDLWVDAPGADDNASGTSAVLEIARILKNYDNKKTIMFVAFSAEELGLYGATYLAGQLSDAGADVELMINLDVISYTDDADPDVDVGHTCPEGYYDAFLNAMDRVSYLYPNQYPGAWWDDAPFYDEGYYTFVSCEGDYNYYMHTYLDNMSIVDFDFTTEVVKFNLAGMLIVDNASEPVQCEVHDVGDGTSLYAFWEEPAEPYTFRIVYGTDSENLTDTIDIPSGTFSQTLTGLTGGIDYYVGLLASEIDHYPALDIPLAVEQPLMVPRTPTDLTAEPDSAAISLHWSANSELDLDHYRLLRRTGTTSYTTHADHITDTFYIDHDVTAGERYYYTLMAVDTDLNESDTSAVSYSSPAFFNDGILFVDETQAGDINPTENQQYSFYNDILDTLTHGYVKIDSSDQRLSRSTAGQYNPIFWIDDDNYIKNFDNSIDSLAWYLQYHTDFLLAGWQTIFSITGHTYFYSGNFFHDQLGLSYIAQNSITDFTGAVGVDGWPDLELKPDAPGGGRMPDIDIFTPASGAQTIYTFNSFSGNPFYADKPVGIAYDTHHGKRIVLGFPLYYLTESSAQALIGRVMEYFAEESVLYGDANSDWAVNILDVTYLVNYLYRDGPQPPDINNGDPNGSCAVNILDATYLINYLYKSGPAPVIGCVE